MDDIAVPSTRDLAKSIAVELKASYRELNRKSFQVSHQGVSFTVTKFCHNIVVSLTSGDRSRATIRPLEEAVGVVSTMASEINFGVRLKGLNPEEAYYFERHNFEKVNHGEYWQMI